jgi:putative ABC transport system permease protein
MNIYGFVARNALRNKRRAILTILSVGISLLLLVTLQVALREMTIPPEDVSASLRIAVRNKISLTNNLPARQRPLIKKMPGVIAVTPLTWFGGKYKDDEGIGFAQFGVDPVKFREIFGEAKMAEDQFDTWIAERASAIVGKKTAEKYGWKLGQTITLTGSIYPVDLELKIVGIYEGTIDDSNVWFHQKYLDELLGATGEVGMWWVRAASADVVPGLIERINRQFANTSAEVRAETERAFQMSFVSMWGNIGILINSICSVVVFTLALVAASTMSMAVRERFRELAILKAIGFRRRELLALILAESFGLCALGALLGVGGAWLLYTKFELSRMLGGIFPVFEVTPRIMAMAASVAALLGIIASIAPAWSTAKMSVVEGLKTID